ncbi:MAG: hypothetical protein ACR2MX_07650 [Cyclobacteriaceae bacterium]
MSTTGSEWEPGPFRQEMMSRRLFMQSKILLSRGVMEEGLHLVRKSSSIAERYEFPDIKIAADDLLRRYCTSSSNSGKYDGLINQSLTHLNNLYQAKNGLYNHGFRTKPRWIPSSGSKKAWFWHQVALINQLFQEKRLLQAKYSAVELLNFLKQEKIVDTRNKRAQTQLCLARVLIHLREYQEAVTVARQAVSNCINCTKEKLESLEVLFFAHLRAGHLCKAEADYRLAQPSCLADPISACKWTLMQAALRFSQERFPLVYKVLNSRGNANKSTRLWILGYKFLEMLTTLELQDYDWYEYKFDLLRKQLQSLNGTTNTRIKLVSGLLAAITKNNYSFGALVRNESETLDYLNSSDSATYWDPMGMEVVNIPQWLIFKSQANS